MKLNEKLSEAFDIETVKLDREVVELKRKVSAVTKEEKIGDDYDLARNNIQDLLLSGQDALESALLIAKSSEHPRAFEVVGNLVKQLSEVNQQLVDLHQHKAKLEAMSGKSEQDATIQNNSIFVGSTAELTKLISNMNKGDNS